LTPFAVKMSNPDVKFGLVARENTVFAANIVPGKMWWDDKAKSDDGWGA